MICYRHGDPRFPFLWETGDQPPARWHGPGEGPVGYLADTPDGAWAEFLRHEEIRDPADLAGIRRRIWAVDLPAADLRTAVRPTLPAADLLGGPARYPACRREARRVRAAGGTVLVAPSAALVPRGATGWRTDGGLVPGPARDGTVVAMFGRRPDLVAHAAVDVGRPTPDLLARVRHFGARVPRR